MILIPNDNDNRKTLSPMHSSAVKQQARSVHTALWREGHGQRRPSRLLQVQRQLFAAALRRSTGIPQPVGRLLGRWTLLLRQWRDAPSASAAFQVPPPPAATWGPTCSLFYQRVAESHFRPWAAWDIIMACLLLMSGREDKGSEGQ